MALACAESGINYSIIAKREVSRLFSEGSVYAALFNPNTDPLRLSRAVAVTSAVDGLLDSIEADADGIEAGVAVHGRRVIAHLVMRRIGDKALADPASDMDDLLKELTTEVQTLVASIVAAFPDNAYPGNVFKNQSRIIGILKDAGLR